MPQTESFTALAEADMEALLPPPQPQQPGAFVCAWSSMAFPSGRPRYRPGLEHGVFHRGKVKGSSCIDRLLWQL